mgnify:FL=1
MALSMKISEISCQNVYTTNSFKLNMDFIDSARKQVDFINIQ